MYDARTRRSGAPSGIGFGGEWLLVRHREGKDRKADRIFSVVVEDGDKIGSARGAPWPCCDVGSGLPSPSLIWRVLEKGRVSALIRLLFLFFSPQLTPQSEPKSPVFSLQAGLSLLPNCLDIGVSRSILLMCLDSTGGTSSLMPSSRPRAGQPAGRVGNLQATLFPPRGSS